MTAHGEDADSQTIFISLLQLPEFFYTIRTRATEKSPAHYQTHR